VHVHSSLFNFVKRNKKFGYIIRNGGYHLTTNLDENTAQQLRKYYKVIAIMLDLHETMKANENLGHYNKLFKRLLIVACVFCVLLLASMLGLSYAVAALTAKTEVNASGALVATGTHNAVAVNLRAEIHSLPMSDNGFHCITWDEVEIMRMEIMQGRNVVLDETNLNGDKKITKLGGGSVTVDADKVCFITSTGETKCVISWRECEGKGVGRTLSADDRRRLGLSEHRRLGPPNGGACASCQIGGKKKKKKKIKDSTPVHACMANGVVVKQPGSFVVPTGCECLPGYDDCMEGNSKCTLTTIGDTKGDCPHTTC
jgi:hypothetical protein